MLRNCCITLITLPDRSDTTGSTLTAHRTVNMMRLETVRTVATNNTSLQPSHLPLSLSLSVHSRGLDWKFSAGTFLGRMSSLFFML